MEGQKVSSEFDVSMKFNIMYDFRLQHSYRQPISIIATAVGVAFIFFYIRYMAWYYLAAALLLILYLPVTLTYSTFLQVKTNPAFKNPIHYKVDDEGITVSVGEQSQSIGWDAISKVRNTSKSYILYTSSKAAFIFPLASMGGEQPKVLETICTHVDPKKVKIRFGGL